MLVIIIMHYWALYKNRIFCKFVTMLKFFQIKFFMKLVNNYMVTLVIITLEMIWVKITSH